MATPHIWLLGSNGQVGHALRQVLPQWGSCRAFDRAAINLAEPESLAGHLDALAAEGTPTVVVNAAAYTAVDRAEAEPEVAMAVNAQSPGVLASWCATRGTCLVHYSTDYVFDGSGEKPWRETDTPAPLSVYGQSKLAGERAIAQALPRHLILRTSWVVSAHGQNFLKTMLRLAAERESLRVVADQWGAPTPASWLAQWTLTALQSLHAAPEEDSRWGLYHAAAAGETHWQAYACAVIEGALRRGAALRATAATVTPISTADYPVAAQRPLNSRLDCQKLRNQWGITPRTWREGIDGILDELLGVSA